MADPRFKIVAYEFGASSVVDRKTNERLGYVLENFYSNWEPFCCRCSPPTGKAVGPLKRYRKDAAVVAYEHAIQCKA